MNCKHFLQDVDAMAAGELSEPVELEMRRHAERCGACARALSSATLMMEEVARARAPEPGPDFETRMLAAAKMGEPAATRRPWGLPVWGGAVAAALVVGIFIGGELYGPKQQAAPVAQTGADVMQEIGAIADQKTVRLAFSSKEAVDNVTLTLELPPNMELAPFPGRHRVSWKVNLKPGDNLLALPMNILFPGEGTLVAHLDDGRKRKTFRTDIGTTMEPSS
ncbi:anti-sigma factor family protein [Marinobacter sp. DUT-1]|uniref:anti-sigma factor family protein n=1 Tax=Marinobacter sp. DUT-1 TaxID=3412037 RepID=UPI003D1868B5